MTLDATVVLDDLDRLIARRSILEHPFYRAWQAGTLTREQLATYAAVYYPHVAAFPDYLRATGAHATDPAVRAELADNLSEELFEPAPHSDLWLAFARGVGGDDGAIRVGAPSRGAKATVDAFAGLCARSAAAGLAALYSYESQQPDVSRQKAEGLRRFYGVSDRESLEYFEVHAEADVRHRDGERRALARCIEAGAGREEVLDAASEALDAYWGLLDEVCARADVKAC
jgi:pyrroloquinoline-quinone synthase